MPGVPGSIDRGIAVLGIGRCGGTTVRHLMENSTVAADWYIIDTDQRDLQEFPQSVRIALGERLTNGLGTGRNSGLGRQAALDDTERLIEILEQRQLVVVAASLGGGVGAGASPIVLSLSKEIGATAVAIITQPFAFEGAERVQAADRSLNDLLATADATIALSPDRLLRLPPETSFSNAFRVVSETGADAIRLIIGFTRPTGAKYDLAIVRSLLAGSGRTVCAHGRGSGEGAARTAAGALMRHPLLDDTGIAGAAALMIAVRGSQELTLTSVNDICCYFRDATKRQDTDLSFVVELDDALDDEVRVSLVAAKFDQQSPKSSEPPHQLADASVNKPHDLLGLRKARSAKGECRYCGSWMDGEDVRCRRCGRRLSIARLTRLTPRDFEIAAFQAISKAVESGRLGLIPKTCRVYHQRKYHSRDRALEFHVDTAIELWLPGAEHAALIWVWECKDWESPLPVGVVEEFHAKLQHIGEDNTRGTLLVSGELQRSALNFALSKGISVARFELPTDFQWSPDPLPDQPARQRSVREDGWVLSLTWEGPQIAKDFSVFLTEQFENILRDDVAFRKVNEIVRLPASTVPMKVAGRVSRWPLLSTICGALKKITQHRTDDANAR
jgi:cell division protein FtsZ